MFCWSCGHENPDTHKFCGECGKNLLKPEQTVRNITTAKSHSREEQKAPAPPETRTATKTPVPSGTMLAPTVTAREPEPAKPTNPLIEEPRVVHEKPVPTSAATTSQATVTPSTPTPIRDHVPNRINGPSFLGLSDESSSRGYESSYLLDEEPGSSSPWRGYLVLVAIVVIGLLVIRNWQDVRAYAGDYAQRLGLSDAPKHATSSPERVTTSNDASKMTPDAAPEEGKSTTPSENKSTNDASKAQQTAKLEKPQGDNDASKDSAKPAGTDEDKPADETANETSKPAAHKDQPIAMAAVDNSQLEEAQKYLQGRGVPQDCNRGVNLLRNAAKAPNAKARIQMAALYVSGHCVTENAAEAYTWFSRAQELEPHNRMIERNLDSLWARMSDDERRKVLR